jgi:hypothetical protein
MTAQMFAASNGLVRAVQLLSVRKVPDALGCDGCGASEPRSIRPALAKPLRETRKR